MAKNKSTIELSDLNRQVADLLVRGSSKGLSLEKSSRKSVQRIRLDEKMLDEMDAQTKAEGKPSLAKSILNELNGSDSITRLAFEADPTRSNQYMSLYKTKLRLLPDELLKRIAIQDDLVASIVQARQNQMSQFGRPRPDRFSMGFIIEAKQDALEKIEEEPDEAKKKQIKKDLQTRIASASKRIMTCGSTKGWHDDELLTFPTYIAQSIRNALVLGRLATEMIWTETAGGQKEFHSFRVVDAGTIYKAAPQQAAAKSLRESAVGLLEQVKNEKLVPEKYMNDEYAYIQVIDGRPVQAFTSKELLVSSFYSIPDIELDGYPCTPLDTAISAVTTHINITTHNKLYFQSGRATRGMLVIKSDDVDESVVARVRQQFNSAINSVNNSWRMPVFGMGTEDEMTWQPIDSGTRDMEFQYLSDMNARVILSAFQMSPEELPGWSYLSRGTNSQSMSESNNEYRLEAHRDLGIRPLLARFEDFFNHSIFPHFDAVLAQMCVVKFVGLDAETAEKESVRLLQDMPVHMTYNEVLKKVEKTPLGERWGGDYPLNPQIQAIFDKFLTVGEQKEKFFGVKDASKDPALAYLRDPFWFQMQQMVQAQQAQQQAAQQQAAMAAQGGQPQDPNGGGGGGAPQDPNAGPQDQPAQDPTQQVMTENQKSDAVGQDANQMASASTGSTGADLTRSIDQAIGSLLSKTEAQLPPGKKALLAQQKAFVLQSLNGWDKDIEEIAKDIKKIAQSQARKK